MINYLDPSADLFLYNTGRIQERIAVANRQISSGKRIAAASDAPETVGALLQVRAELSHNTRIQSNLVQAKAEADAADNALASALKLMDTAIGLCTQGTSFVMTDGGRQSLARQVQALQEQMVGLTQTTVQGRYIFNGDQDNSAAFTFNAAAAAGSNSIDRLNAAPTATRRLEDPSGGSFRASLSGQEIFDYGHNADGTAAPQNVFAALDNLRLALLSNSQPAIGGCVVALRAASDHLMAQQSFFGNVQNRISAANDFAASRNIRLRAQLSTIEDADAAAAAVDMAQANVQLQAAFQMRAKMPHTTLFDFLG